MWLTAGCPHHHDNPATNQTAPADGAQQPQGSPHRLPWLWLPSLYCLPEESVGTCIRFSKGLLLKGIQPHSSIAPTGSLSKPGLPGGQNTYTSISNPNEGSYVYFFHIYLSHVGSSQLLKTHFHLDFIFICHIKHPSLDCITYKSYKHISCLFPYT